MTAYDPDQMPDISRLAALLSDPGRARMLLALLDGKPHPATDLAQAAGLSLPAASNHLSRLLEGRVVQAERAGRHRYYALATAEMAQAIEALSAAAASADMQRPHFRPKGTPALRLARTCYDHLAGRLGVTVTDALLRKKFIALDDETKRFAVSARGRRWFVEQLEVEEEVFEQKRRPLATACLDWSERRYHMAGALGAALCKRFLARRLVQRQPGGRALAITAAGREFLLREIGWRED